ncbi:MAG: hypothetical protein HY744_00635 [Deltaproteobacteria bacterium]|nr:hypothetical protein [Deltaproteobacteria bacterium]
MLALDAAGDARLLSEALAQLGVADDLGQHQLERAARARALLLGLVHRTHPALGDQADDPVVAREERARLERALAHRG